MEQPYASLATILETGLGFRTAFFQSATGTFEARPGLVHNLGFHNFFAREDLHDPNEFIGYLGGDEFAMLDPVGDWIASEKKPFLAVILCSVTHDPYEVPAWYDAKADTQEARYLQTITYTDRFLAALDAKLTELNLADETIFCVVGDHGEAFSEHGMMGHERIAYDEVLHVAMCLRAPGLVQPGTRVNAPVSSVDLTPTLLGLLGFDVAPMAFDGSDALAPLPADRKVFLAGWMQQGPAGFIQGCRKTVYSPESGNVRIFDLDADPLELNGVDLPESEAQELSKEIVAWRRNTILKMDDDAQGQTVLFGSWQSKWTGRRSKVKYIESK
jgi:phosphoglycerol transferase MdoB-like AlkP superfamily enzyme